MLIITSEFLRKLPRAPSIHLPLSGLFDRCRDGLVEHEKFRAKNLAERASPTTPALAERGHFAREKFALLPFLFAPVYNTLSGLFTSLAHRLPDDCRRPKRVQFANEKHKTVKREKIFVL
jgi:hypothetical protein